MMSNGCRGISGPECAADGSIAVSQFWRTISKSVRFRFSSERMGEDAGSGRKRSRRNSAR